MAKRGPMFTNNLDHLQRWFEKNKDKTTPETLYEGLVNAIERKNMDIAKFFIENGADIDIVDENEDTLLVLAIKAGLWDLAKILINNPKLDLDDINHPNKDGDTALILSVSNLEIVQLLLNRGANIHHKNVKECDAFLMSCSKGSLDITKLLLVNGADINTVSVYGNNALFIAYQNDKLDTVKFLLDEKINIQYINNGENILISVIYTKPNIEAFKLLVEAGANVNFQNPEGETPLMKAVYAGWTDYVKILLENGANPNLENSKGDTALLKVINENALEIIQLLIQYGANANHISHYDENALFKTAECGLAAATKFLLENGVNPDQQNDTGLTPLILASFQSYFDGDYINTAKFLLEHNANPDLYTVEEKTTALHQAMLKNNPDMIKLLVENDANVNLPNNNGETPIFYAVLNVNIDMIKYLIENNANFNHTDKDGNTILDKSADEEIRAFLKGYIQLESLNFDFPDITGFDPLEGVDVNIKDFMKTNEQLLIKKGQQIFCCNRVKLRQFYNMEWKLYGGEKVSHHEFDRVRNAKNLFLILEENQVENDDDDEDDDDISIFNDDYILNVKTFDEFFNI
jgi:ankyrin repeat protein